ncbi:MAG: tRNA 2-thiocytidine biosynthesis protein TtcA [Treponema sp.]|nr:tRNA 2-thiocytidine biosynthesis protein TtcA [Treponema sp.]
MGQPRIFSIIDKACYDYKMIEEGDRILVGASGGKDSTALIEYLYNRKKRLNSNFVFECVFIKTEFGKPLPPNILSCFEKWNIVLKTIDIDIEERSREDKKLGCYWCSTQRRTELLKYAIDNNFNKIALGHHRDDILETVLMNAIEKGCLGGMPPRLKYEKYPIELIRPLCYVPQDLIIERAKEQDYSGFTCTCNFQDNSTRKIAREKLKVLSDNDEKIKERLFNAFVKK